MKKLKNILATISSAIVIVCSGTIGVKSEVVYENETPSGLRYTISNDPKEIFDDMQILEDYIEDKIGCSGFKTASERTLRWESEYCYKLRGYDPKKAESLATKMSFKDDKDSFNALSAIKTKHEELNKHYYVRTLEENEVGTCRAISGWISEMLNKTKINCQIITVDTGNLKYNHNFIAYQIPDSGDIWYVLPCGCNPQRRTLKDLTIKNYFCDLYDYYENEIKGTVDLKLFIQPEYVGQDIIWWKPPNKNDKCWNELLETLDINLVPGLIDLK